MYFTNIRNTSTASTASAASRVGAVIGAQLVAWVVRIREAGVVTVGALCQRTLAVGRFCCFHVIVTNVFLATKLTCAVCSFTRFALCSGLDASRFNQRPFLVGIETIFSGRFTRSHARLGRVHGGWFSWVHCCAGWQISRFSNSYVFLEWGVGVTPVVDACEASRGSGVFTTRCPIIILSTTISFAICINRMPVRITNQTIGKFCWISRFTPFHRIINVTTFGVVSYTLTCQ